ncbi:hypothetical protein ONS95_002834 [Cadophora gregata]|uniref:uncharacterized protein n=1 Tax=Cadophora gregata TaxID=51156 RepID=UPI0026DCEBAF|nr:uncharacterized protein ONS95_002834 [Cadophora gregata]KAK0110183.1 hypothetical protein ONS95_002834 [Cadophora gregata]KAK0110200.1 hypothetical protein ONS96_001823 [Cadophora gregata f. sp. sojae]
MRFLLQGCAIFGFLFPTVLAQRYVFAHMIVGNTAAHTQATWAADITLARNTGIDAFVLNMGYPDPNIYGQVANAFAAAEAAGSGFKLFFSFDYLGGGTRWPSTGARSVVSYLNQYKNSPAYFRFNGLPMASTFEGTSDIDAWAYGGVIRNNVGGIYFVPDWSSLGPGGFAQHLGKVEGAFNWDAWPTGATNINTAGDVQWRNMLGAKSYMMPVSPWFFRSANGGNRWVWRGDDSWADRWAQVISFAPTFVQIISWNDFGESHYVGPVRSANEIPAGSGIYVDGQSHESWLDFLPYYIAKYKGSSFTITRDQMQYWYRNAPLGGGGTCGVVGNDAGHGEQQISPNAILYDGIFASALLKSPAAVHVQIGSNPVIIHNFGAGLTHWSQCFCGQTGVPKFWVVRNGVTTGSGTGKAINPSTSLSNGCTNYNPWVGSF